MRPAGRALPTPALEHSLWSISDNLAVAVRGAGVISSLKTVELNNSDDDDASIRNASVYIDIFQNSIQDIVIGID
ncbi:MAG: hypothetical protein MHPSP_000087 [Paramarteilia canceri]